MPDDVDQEIKGQVGWARAEHKRLSDLILQL